MHMSELSYPTHKREINRVRKTQHASHLSQYFFHPFSSPQTTSISLVTKKGGPWDDDAHVNYTSLNKCSRWMI